MNETKATVSSAAAKGVSSEQQQQFDYVIGPSKTNESLYTTVVKPTLTPFMEGRHSCVMAYGQTGSGKTHSVFGWNAADEGVVPRLIRDLFATCHANRRALRYRIAVSFVEVYCERVNDLLDPSMPSSELSLRETAAGACFVPNATVRVCHTAEAALRLLAHGNANKTIGQSYVHDRSSRGHTIFTVMYAGERNVAGEAASTVVARYSFVDLAGSELLVEGLGGTQQTETKAINLSLLTLRGVIDALASKAKHLPYRESVLTRLLSQPLSASGSAIAVCACSPNPAHASLTAGTLRFADVAGRVKQQAAMNVFVRNAAGNIALSSAEPVVEKVALKDAGGSSAPGAAGGPPSGPSAEALAATRTASELVDARGTGGVFTRIYTSKHVPPVTSGPSGVTSVIKIALFLHAFGDGCDGEDFAFLYPDLVAAGYVVVAPDFPGFGRSPGSRQASRTDRLWNPDGPLPTVESVLSFAVDWTRREYMVAGSNVKTRLLLFGYDWGGNMALSLAMSAKWRPKLSGMVLYHPSWTDKIPDLAAIKTVPTLLCWVPTDQLHLFSRGKQMAQYIKNSKLVSIVPEAGKTFSWSALEKALYRVIVPWLRTGKLLAVPTPAAPPAAAAAETANGDAAAAAVAPPAAVDVPLPPPGVDEGEEDLDELLERVRQASEAQLGAGGGDSSSDTVTDSDDDDGSATVTSAALTSQSSFLANLLADPLRTDELIADRARTLEAERKRAVEALRRVRVQEQLGTLADELRTAGDKPEKVAVVHLRFVLESPNGLNGISRATIADALLKRGAGAAMRPDLLRLIGGLPTIVPYAKPQSFVSCGLWRSAPAGCDERRAMPRYPRGRRVFVPMDGIFTDFTESSTFGFARSSDPARVKVNASNGFLTSRCVVRGPGLQGETSWAAVDVLSSPGATAVTVDVPVSVLDKWNGATAFPTGGGSGAHAGEQGTTVTFEDAIRANYHSLAMRCKIAECALAVDGLVAQMDFSAAVHELGTTGRNGVAGDRLLELQKAAVTKIRTMMNCTHHVQMGRDLARLCVPDCGRLATFGQWHCHGMASVFASMLLPFASALGLEVKYRDGFYYHAESRDTKGSGWNGVPRALADHTWLEVTFHPSGVTFCVDPSFTDNGEPIIVPLDEAYSASGRRYPVRDLTTRVASMKLHGTKAVPLHEPTVPAVL